MIKAKNPETFSTTLTGDKLLNMREFMSNHMNPTSEKIDQAMLEILKSFENQTKVDDTETITEEEIAIILIAFKSGSNYLTWAQSLIEWMNSQLTEGISLEMIDNDEGREMYGAYHPGITFIKATYNGEKKFIVLSAAINPITIMDWPTK